MLTVVIPTLNAGETLTACLATVAGAKEIIVVDGGSTDDTIEVAGKVGARLIGSAKGRGVQLMAGGDAATEDWLLFLHADTRLGPAWREAVAAHIDHGPGTAGYFRLRLDDGAWQARVIEKGVAARTAVFGLSYGDQGLLISRSLYQAVGGFRPLPLMEDVDLVRRIGRPRLKMLGECAWTSAARWRRDGWIRRSARNLACLGLYAIGVAPEKIAEYYS